MLTLIFPRRKAAVVRCLLIVLLIPLILYLSKARFETDFFSLRYVGDRGNYIDHHVRLYGAYEKPILFFMRDYLRELKSRGKEETVFVDIGANNGHHSLFMSLVADTVHAFEPYPPVLERFYEMVKLNKIENIRIHPVGLGNENQTLPFFEPKRSNLSTGSFVSKFYDYNEGEPSMSLEIRVGDEVLKEAGVRHLDLIKIDIEGYERAAMQGLRQTLERDRPVVIMELNVVTETGFRNQQELEDTFPQGYSFLVFDKNCDLQRGTYELAAYDFAFDPNLRLNLLAYPSEKQEYIPMRTPS